MDLYTQFEMLGRKQMAFNEGIQMMQQLQRDFQVTNNQAKAWGITAVLANAVLIPLNCIVNAFELGAAANLYQTLAKELYKSFGQSGSRTTGVSKQALAILQKSIVESLTKSGLTQYVPGVNILAGLAQDSIALIQAMETVGQGSVERRRLDTIGQQKINEMTRKLSEIGIIRSQLLQQMQNISRTA